MNPINVRKLRLCWSKTNVIRWRNFYDLDTAEDCFFGYLQMFFRPDRDDDEGDDADGLITVKVAESGRGPSAVAS